MTYTITLDRHLIVTMALGFSAVGVLLFLCGLLVGIGLCGFFPAPQTAGPETPVATLTSNAVAIVQPTLAATNLPAAEIQQAAQQSEPRAVASPYEGPPPLVPT